MDRRAVAPRITLRPGDTDSSILRLRLGRQDEHSTGTVKEFTYELSEMVSQNT